MKLDLVSLKGYVMSSTVFFVIFVLSMTLGSLSTNVQGCILVLLKYWHGTSGSGACWPSGEA